MESETFELVKDIFLLLLFLVGMLWMWRIIRYPNTATQQKLDRLFERSRERFKWLFLIGFLLLLGLFIWDEILKR